MECFFYHFEDIKLTAGVNYIYNSPPRHSRFQHHNTN